MKIFRTTGFITLLLIGCGGSSFAGLQELFDFEDKMSSHRWVTHGPSSLSTDHGSPLIKSNLEKTLLSQ